MNREKQVLVENICGLPNAHTHGGGLIMNAVFASILFVSVLAGVSALFPNPCDAVELGHYIHGSEGLNAATLPPPDFYASFYTILYSPDRLTAPDGGESRIEYQAEVLSLVTRLQWISPCPIMGADFGISAFVPVVDKEVFIIRPESDPVEKEGFGLGDICLEPVLLGWHASFLDLMAGFEVFTPTGGTDDGAASPGHDFWTSMFTAGGTAWFDVDHTWSLSILSRYEIHSQKGSVHIRPGDDFHCELGFGKTIGEAVEMGLAGYGQWQVSDDSGSAVAGTEKHRDSVLAAGPEVGLFFEPGGLHISARQLWEFNAKDRPEGTTTAITVSGHF